MKMLDKGWYFETEFVITPEIYHNFISTFNDRNPLHVDQRYAVEKGFESTVMHGNILGGFLSYVIGECLPQKNVIIHSQEIKYTKPVYLKETLYFYIIAESAFPSVAINELRFFFSKDKQKTHIVARGKIQIGFV